MFNNNYLYLKEKRLVLLKALKILKKLNLASKLHLLKNLTTVEPRGITWGQGTGKNSLL